MNILDKLKEFQYTSLEHATIDDISDLIICIDNNESLFFYSIVDENAIINWATNLKESFFSGLKETINLICQDQTIKKVYIEFIPEHFVSEMEDLGFVIISEWVDFWNDNLATICLEKSSPPIIRSIKENEYQTASGVTKSCKGYSRGYEGETSEWIREWNDSENSCIFVAEMNNEIIGICCVRLYGFESEKGIILWIREVAVKPRHHSQNIGFNLVAYSINWGKRNGAVRSFLACDIENIKAIKLYEGLGYKSKTMRGQINMEKTLLQY